MEPKFPRDETMDEFRKQFFKDSNGISYQWYSDNSLDGFIENHQDEIDEGGVMNPGHNLCLFTGPTEGLYGEMLTRMKDIEPEEIDFDADVLEHIKAQGKALRIENTMLAISKTIKILKVLGSNKVKVYYKDDFPIFFENDHGEIISLAPIIGYSGGAWTISDAKDKLLELIRVRREISENPDRVIVNTVDSGFVEMKVSSIEELTIGAWWGEFKYLMKVVMPPDRNEPYETTKDVEITRESFEQLREENPDIPVNDTRKPDEDIDLEEITNAVQAAWKHRDPQFEDVDLYTKCLDDVIEHAQYHMGLPCSLDFYVKHFGQEPPRLVNKLRSMYTAEEWGRTFLEAVKGNIERVELNSRSLVIRFGDEDEDWSTKMDELLDLDIPTVYIKAAKYKAKHLLHFKSDITHGGSGWSGWEQLEKLRDYEAEHVRA